MDGERTFNLSQLQPAWPPPWHDRTSPQLGHAHLRAFVRACVRHIVGRRRDACASERRPCVCGGPAAPSEAARLLLLLPPLVLALLVVGAGHTLGASVCDTAICGKGNCSETPAPLPLLPNYECHCDRGWSQPNALKLFPFSPCIVPDCSSSFNAACLNISPTPPPLKETLSVCSVVSCGAGGKCTPEGDPLSFKYSCQCHPGYANLLNLTTLPCVNCFLGDACYALGLGPPPPAPAPSSPSGPSAPPPSATNGNATDHDSLGTVSSPSLLQLLLLVVSVAVVQVV